MGEGGAYAAEPGIYMSEPGPFFFTCTEIGSKFAPVLSQHQNI
jgi:hypothetical protein